MRKVKAFYFTVIVIALLIVGAFISSVQFTGDHIITMIVVIGTLAGAFFGANAGEHFAKSRVPK